MKIAHFGTFDVDNYGDLLFPLLVEKRLAHLNATFVHVSPSGGKPELSDCLDCQSIGSVVESAEAFDAAILAGGNLVHDGLSNIPKYQGTGLFEATYPSLWLTPAVMNCCFDIPVCWNAVGVGRPLELEVKNMTSWALKGAAYACVRDEYSYEWLGGKLEADKVEACVDTALEVRSLWSVDEINEAYKHLLKRKGVDSNRDTLAFHFRYRYIGETVEKIAEIILQACKSSNTIPILVAIGNCHGDGSYARDVAKILGSEVVVLDDPESLREIAASIALSKAYIGSSLHGAITAYSYGVRSLVIASSDVSKFSGFLSRVGGEKWRCETWSDAPGVIDKLFASDKSLWEGACDRLKPEIDLHWERLVAALTSKKQSVSSSDREREMPEIPLKWASLLHLWEPLSKNFEAIGLKNASFDLGFSERIHEQLVESALSCDRVKELGAEKERLEKRCRQEGKAEKTRGKRINKIQEAVNHLYHSSRWRIGNILSGKGWSKGGVIEYSPLESSLKDLISDHKKSLRRAEDSKGSFGVTIVSSGVERKRNFIFITGCQRSGTTAATKLLTHHREIAVGMERFKYLREGGVMAKNFTVDCFLKENFFNYKESETNQIPDKVAKKFKEEYFDLLERGFDQAILVGDKNPEYFTVYPCLLRRFAGCRIVVMHRNPFDVAHSWDVKANNKASKWPEENDFKVAVSQWNLCIEKTLESASEFSEQFKVVEYSRLFSDKKYYKELLGWLGASDNQEDIEHYGETLKMAAELRKKDRQLSPEKKKYVEEHARWDLEDLLLEKYAL